ncbi:MAG: DDE-type integrase/transposase/recombinase [Henriciella sp.]
MPKSPFRCFKTSPEVIRLAVMMYVRFPLSLRHVEDKSAALRFFRKAMKRYGAPKEVVADRLRSYRAAMKEIGNADRKEVGRHLNNRSVPLTVPANH